MTASRGVKLVADALIADCAGKTYDCIALPGGMPGAEHLRDSAELIGMLKKQKAAGRLYASDLRLAGRGPASARALGRSQSGDVLSLGCGTS